MEADDGCPGEGWGTAARLVPARAACRELARAGEEVSELGRRVATGATTGSATGTVWGVGAAAELCCGGMAHRTTHMSY